MPTRRILSLVACAWREATCGPPPSGLVVLGQAAQARRLASVDVYGRLVGLFDVLAVNDAGQRVAPGPLSQVRIAERLGASRAMVNRLLQDLTQGGYTEVSRGHIVLLCKLPRRCEPVWRVFLVDVVYAPRSCTSASMPSHIPSTRSSTRSKPASSP